MSMQDVPDPDKPETWKFFMMTNWLGEGEFGLSNEDRLKALKERGAKLAEVRSHRVSYNGSRLIPTPQPFRKAMLEIPEDTSAPCVELVCWIAEPWNTLDGRVTLAGDAAHPMPPFKDKVAITRYRMLTTSLKWSRRSSRQKIIGQSFKNN